MICKKCGKELSENAKFCTSCGEKISAEVPAEVKAPAEDKAEVKAPAAETEPAENPVHNDAQAEEIKPEEIKMPEENAPEVKIPSQAMSASEPVHEEEPEKPKKIGAGRFIGAGVIALFAFIFLMLFNVLISARIGFSSDIIHNTAEKLRMETLLDSELENGQTVAEYIYSSLDHGFKSKTGAQVKDIREILIECETQDFIAETLSGYAAYIVNGSYTENPSLTTADIADFLRENGDIVMAELDSELAASDYDYLVENAVGDDFNEYASVTVWSDEIGFSVHSFHFFFSFITIGVAAALVLLLFIWIAVVLGRQGKHITGYISTILLITGLLFLLPSAAFLIGSGVSALYSGSAADYAASVLLVPFAAIAAATGAFETIVAVILRKIRKHIRKNELKKTEAEAEKLPEAADQA